MMAKRSTVGKRSTEGKRASTNYICPRDGSIWSREEYEALDGKCGQCGGQLESEYAIHSSKPKGATMPKKIKIKRTSGNSLVVGDIKLSVQPKTDTGEWVVWWIENGRKNEAKSYFTDDKTDAMSTMQDMAKRIPQLKTSPYRYQNVAFKNKVKKIEALTKDSKTQDELIAHYVNLYRDVWGSNAGLSTAVLKQMTPTELEQKIKSLQDYHKMRRTVLDVDQRRRSKSKHKANEEEWKVTHFDNQGRPHIDIVDTWAMKKIVNELQKLHIKYTVEKMQKAQKKLRVSMKDLKKKAGHGDPADWAAQRVTDEIKKKHPNKVVTDREIEQAMQGEYVSDFKYFHALVYDYLEQEGFKVKGTAKTALEPLPKLIEQYVKLYKEVYHIEPAQGGFSVSRLQQMTPEDLKSRLDALQSVKKTIQGRVNKKADFLFIVKEDNQWLVGHSVHDEPRKGFQVLESNMTEQNARTFAKKMADRWGIKVVMTYIRDNSGPIPKYKQIR